MMLCIPVVRVDCFFFERLKNYFSGYIYVVRVFHRIQYVKMSILHACP
jgi:hypothetical protein